MALLQEIMFLAIRANNIILLKILMSTMQSLKPNFVIVLFIGLGSASHGIISLIKTFIQKSTHTLI
jgi:hypothetical protein